MRKMFSSGKFFRSSRVECFGGRAVVAEWLFDHQPGVSCRAGLRDPLRHDAELVLGGTAK